VLVVLRALQQRSELGAGRFGGGYRNELRAENEAARRVHQRDAVEVSITLGSHRRAVESKCDPGFVDLKLLRMEHKKSVPMMVCKRGSRNPLGLAQAMPESTCVMVQSDGRTARNFSRWTRSINRSRT
jgi:hypothetical protein